jgi:hypothetical protein
MQITIQDIKIMLADELIAKRMNEQRVTELETRIKELEKKKEDEVAVDSD